MMRTEMTDGAIADAWEALEYAIHRTENLKAKREWLEWRAVRWQPDDDADRHRDPVVYCDPGDG